MNRTIQSKDDYLYFLECDRVALRCKTKRPRFMTDEIWRFERLLRKREYYNNVLNNRGGKLSGRYAGFIQFFCSLGINE